MAKFKIALAAIVLSLVATKGFADTVETEQPAETVVAPQTDSADSATEPVVNPEQPAANVNDDMLGTWRIAYAACTSQYGAYYPSYPLYIEIVHARTEFIARSQVRDEVCRIEGTYATAEDGVKYEVKSQDCSIAKLADDLKAKLEQGYITINLSSEVADKVCPFENSALEVYLVQL